MLRKALKATSPILGFGPFFALRKPAPFGGRPHVFVCRAVAGNADSCVADRAKHQMQEGKHLLFFITTHCSLDKASVPTQSFRSQPKLPFLHKASVPSPSFSSRRSIRNQAFKNTPLGEAERAVGEADRPSASVTIQSFRS